MKRVGYWISDKKGKKLNFDGFVNYCRNTGLELIKINLDVDLELQGPFDAIIHKLTDVIAKADSGFEKEIQQIQVIQSYCHAHPHVVVLDPIVHVQLLLDRYRQYRKVLECPIVAKGDTYKIPTFVELTCHDINTNVQLMRDADVTFPLVCKPLLAHGIKSAHQMALVFNAEGLADIDMPCVAQTFINHDAIMYKIFVVGSNYSIVERPSLKNFVATEDQNTIHFDSHDISCSNATGSLVKRDDDCSPADRPPAHIFYTLAHELQQTFQLNLFGIDVIVDKSNGTIAIIDINSFPGYDGVADVFPSMSQLIHDVINKKSANVDFNVENCNPISNGETNGTSNGTGHGSMNNGITNGALTNGSLNVKSVKTVENVLSQKNGVINTNGIASATPSGVEPGVETNGVATPGGRNM